MKLAGVNYIYTYQLFYFERLREDTKVPRPPTLTPNKKNAVQTPADADPMLNHVQRGAASKGGGSPLMRGMAHGPCTPLRKMFRYMHTNKTTLSSCLSLIRFLLGVCTLENIWELAVINRRKAMQILYSSSSRASLQRLRHLLSREGCGRLYADRRQLQHVLFPHELIAFHCLTCRENKKQDCVTCPGIDPTT